MKEGWEGEGGCKGEGGRGAEITEGERKAGKMVDEGRQREVSVNYCL